jgi:carbon-monoxide dehydrogenase small subunit
MDDLLSFEITVNGETEKVTARASDTLLTVLRETLHLTGAKRGCDQGVCGTCTVLIDGVPMRACLSLAADRAGSDIVTIEGLGEVGALSPVQAAFVDTGAIQCGFCSGGMILTVTALLDDNPAATDDQIRQAISGNLCRCTGYGKIVEAALKAAEGAR